jgi:hypothetical protein
MTTGRGDQRPVFHIEGHMSEGMIGRVFRDGYIPFFMRTMHQSHLADHFMELCIKECRREPYDFKTMRMLVYYGRNAKMEWALIDRIMRDALDGEEANRMRQHIEWINDGDVLES